eukprot:650620_1
MATQKSDKINKSKKKKTPKTDSNAKPVSKKKSNKTPKKRKRTGNKSVKSNKSKSSAKKKTKNVKKKKQMGGMFGNDDQLNDDPLGILNDMNKAYDNDIMSTISFMNTMILKTSQKDRHRPRNNH